MKTILTLISFILLMGSATAAVEKSKKNDLPKVFVETLKLKDISRDVEYLGRIVPVREVKIYSPIEGVVTSLTAKLGQKVKRNQQLAVIVQNVVGLEVMPLRVKAPINGFLYRPRITANAFIGKNSHLFTVYDPTKFKLEINTSPNDGELIVLDQKIEVSLGGKIVSGIVNSISQEIDPMTGTRLVEILVDTTDFQLRPGMLAKAKFKYNPHKGFLLNKKLVKKKGTKNYIRVVMGDNKVKELEVNIVSRLKNNVEIENKDLKDLQSFITKSSVEPLLNDQEVNIIKSDNKKL